ncbi:MULTISPECIES: alpha/beta fold hydrolase [unclassified Acidovorax]|uniref:esterase/lipase family protein n=1 Tax=unclassified Acidovorax TaxID=2684926 RepID=UPI002882D809|nr:MULTISPECIES: alpha/beta fold hydrolase [unclassified Acidovorax]
MTSERQTTWAAWLRTIALAAVAALLAGCAGVQVDSISTADYLRQRRSDVLTTGELSPAAREVLRVVGLDETLCERDAPACRETLRQSPGITDEQRLATLAEVWLDAAQAGARAAATDAPPLDVQIGLWLEAARHAYAYLFFSDRAPSERAFEDRQAQVRDYYNYAVQEALTAMFRARPGLDDPRRREEDARQTATVGDWHLDFSALQRDSFDPDAVREIIPAASLRFSGLRNVYRRDGFGAELVLVMAPPKAQAATPPGRADEAAAPFQTMQFPPATALMAFEGATRQQVLATRDIRVLVRDPYRTASETIAAHAVPLAANFTAGYGLWLARSGFATQALNTVLGRAGGIDRPRVDLLQPYDPDRRIIVMLHGLASSPEAWINVANEVLGDETLRRNYQIWQVYYPTNAPLAVNRHMIGAALHDTLAHFDPAGTARASQRITLVGHSMGGVLSRLLVSSSGDRLWNALQSRYELPDDEPGPEAPAEVGPQPQQAGARQALDRYLRFDAMPQVSDAIFIAAPHRGTPFANQRLARWAANLISLPVSMVRQLADITRVMGRLRAREVSPETGARPLAQIPNSIDNLSDRDEYVQWTADLPVRPGVRYHSIIGNNTPGVALTQSSDGIVPYASAHLPGALSELVLPSAHSVQEHPRAILEIRRILSQELQDDGGGVTP